MQVGSLAGVTHARPKWGRSKSRGSGTKVAGYNFTESWARLRSVTLRDASVPVAARARTRPQLSTPCASWLDDGVHQVWCMDDSPWCPVQSSGGGVTVYGFRCDGPPPNTVQGGPRLSLGIRFLTTSWIALVRRSLTQAGPSKYHTGSQVHWCQLSVVGDAVSSHLCITAKGIFDLGLRLLERLVVLPSCIGCWSRLSCCFRLS